MADLPTILYKVPGPHIGADGRGFAYLGVSDEAEYAAAKADDWHDTMGEAMAADAPEAKTVIAEIAEAKEAVAEMAPETREALEEQAKELGVSFNARTKDEVLAERIAEALQ